MAKILIIVLIVTVVGIVGFSVVDRVSSAITDGTTTSTSADTDDMLTVTISGEVTRPGTYLVDEDSTLGDLISKASGATSNADPLAYNTDYVLLNNLSFYIAPIYDNGDTCAVTPITKVNINEDTKSTLMTIDGIGDAIATNLISYRESTSLFYRIEDIKNVTGIGDATFTKIKDHIRLKNAS